MMGTAHRQSINKKSMKRINIFLGGLAALLLSSCFSDKSNYDYLQPVDIRVEGVDEAYTVSPTGDRLQINPKIYPDNRQYDCFWTVVPASASWGDKPDTISRNRNLDYAVNMNVGSYKMRFCAKDQETGVFAYEEYNLYVTTDMATGWWVLKSEGDSADVDFFSEKKTKLDVIQAANGRHLQGTAVDLYFNFSYWRFDEVNKRDKRGNAVFVASSKDLMAVDYFTGKTILDYDGLFVDKPAKREVHAMFAGPSDVHVYVDNTVYTLFFSRYDIYKQFILKSLGDYKLSPVRHAGNSLPLLFNEKNRSFCSVSRQSPRLDYFADGVPSSKNMGMDLLFMGGLTTSAYTPGGVAMALMKKTDEEKYYLLTLNGQPSTMDLNPISKMEEIDASLNVLKAKYRTLNQNNKILYYVKDNKLCTCNLENMAEAEQNVSWPADERVTYMEYLKYSPYGQDSSWFDYLAVGTTRNGSYKLYLYPVSAGAVSPAVKVMEGKGEVKRASFMSQTSSGTYTSTLF